MTTHHSEDNQLLLRMKAGETQALDVLFLKYYSNLMRFSKSLLPYPSDVAEDVVLEVFQKLWQDREWIVVHTSLSSLLYKSVKNRIYDYRRKNQSASLMRLEDMTDDVSIDYATPEQLLDYKELAENLERFTKMMPERMQVIFRMSREDGLTYREIAELLELSIESVKTQMYRAIKFLKDRCSVGHSTL